MDDLGWRSLRARFPWVPSNFRIEHVGQRAKRGRPLQGGNRPVIALAFSPDSASLAACGGGAIPGAVDIRIFEIASRKLRKTCHYHCMGVFNLAFDPRSALLASASHDYSVVLWDLDRDGAVFLVGGLDAGISRNAAGFVGTRVIVADGMTFAGERASLTSFDMATGDIRTLFQLDGDLGVSRLVVLPEEELLIAAIDNQHFQGCPEIRCLTIDGAERARCQLATMLYDLAAIDARTLVVTGKDRDGQTEVLVVDAESGQTKARRNLGPEIGAYVASSPARDRIALAYGHGVQICSLESLQPERQLPLADERACSVAWSPDGAWIAVGTLERTVRLFEAATGREHLV